MNFRNKESLWAISIYKRKSNFYKLLKDVYTLSWDNYFMREDKVDDIDKMINNNEKFIWINNHDKYHKENLTWRFKRNLSYHLNRKIIKENIKMEI